MNDFDKLPFEILKHIIDITGEEHEYRDGALHVTELVYCLRRAYLRRTRGSAERDISQLWYLYRGLIFDQLWCKLFPRNQIRVTHRIPNGPVIVGKIDFIVEEEGEPIIYELKTVSNKYALREGPKEAHVEQVKFYAWCENVRKARLIYVSLEGVRIFDIDCSDADEIVSEIVERAKLLYNCLKHRKLPPKTKNEWECSHCEYGDLCRLEEMREEIKSLVVME